MYKKTAFLGMMTAFALILGYIESLIPFYFGAPGIKLGLANFIVVLLLYKVGIKEAFWVNVLRIILSGFLFGSLFAILYSLAGGICSFLCMLLMKKRKGFSTTGISIVGGITHNIAQLLIAMFVVQTSGVGYYLPVLLIAGMVTGSLIGLVATQVIQRTTAINFENGNCQEGKRT